MGYAGVGYGFVGYGMDILSWKRERGREFDYIYHWYRTLRVMTGVMEKVRFGSVCENDEVIIPQSVWYIIDVIICQLVLFTPPESFLS